MRLLTAALAAAFISAGLPAVAHEAPMHWAYDSSCCSGQDCAVELGEVRATDQGWLLLRTGNLVPYRARQLRISKDDDFHSCWSGNRRDDPDALLCLYVPPQGF